MSGHKIHVSDKEQLILMSEMLDGIKNNRRWVRKEFSCTGRVRAQIVVLPVRYFINHTTVSSFEDEQTIHEKYWTVWGEKTESDWSVTMVYYRRFSDGDGVEACKEFCRIVESGGHEQ